MNDTGYWKEKSRFIENKLVAKYLLFHRKKVNNGPLYMVRIITAVIVKVKVKLQMTAWETEHSLPE